MTQQEQIVLIENIRQMLIKLIQETDTPALYECYKLADMNLHWAKWLMGEVDQIMPELEYQVEL
jgi:hypothetical protein